LLGIAMVSSNTAHVRYNIGEPFLLLALVAVWLKDIAYTLIT
jgi:hypothetical protein